MNAQVAEVLASIVEMLEVTSTERLPDEPERYFTMPAGAEMIPLSAVKTIRARPDGIAHAAGYMAAAYNGTGKKRSPISLRADGDGTYTVVDGNSTVSVARQNGWKNIVALVSEEQESARIQQMEALIEKATGPEWRPGSLFKKGMSLPQGWRLAWGKPYPIKGGAAAQDPGAAKGINATRSLYGAVREIEKASKAGVLPKDISPEQHIEIAEKFLDRHAERLQGLQDDLKALAPFGKVKARVKTLDSAIGKLVRKPKYKTADRLQDGTGARVICDTVDDVRKAVANIRAKFKVIPPEDNYIENPLGGESGMGYRSYHMIIEDKDGLQKEIQVRTKNENTHADWAHDAYKPRTPEQAALRKKYSDVIDQYSRDMSDYYYAKESGRKPSPVPCPVALKDTFGCLPL